jgi:hypothetical protein
MCCIHIQGTRSWECAIALLDKIAVNMALIDRISALLVRAQSQALQAEQPEESQTTPASTAETDTDTDKDKQIAIYALSRSVPP